jgi:RNA polymerase sigma-70 factor (ECF subfamily)
VVDDQVVPEVSLTLEGVYRDDGRKLWWSLLALCGDREIATDAVAEAFAQALARGDQIRDPRAWVWRVAFALARGEMQRARASSGSVPDLADTAAGQVQELLELLRHLSRNQRAAIILHYYADRPVREVATTLGMSTATAKVHLHRGRKRLKELLEDDDG